MLTIALDAMGGDFGPHVTVPAAVQALLLYPELNIQLVGNHSQLTQQLALLNHTPNARLSLLHSDQVISDVEKPSVALRQGAQSSMAIAIEQVALGKADACISAGNTGALMALSRHRLKLLPGIERPALVSALPNIAGGKTWMLDLGANVSSDADSLFQFAVMGSALAQQYLTHPPRIALLNIGAEEIKGNDQIKRCSQLLQQTAQLHFVGYIEANQLLHNQADVIVCDGFSGNVCLKSCEGTAQLLLDKFKQNLLAPSLKGWLARRLFSTLFVELKTLNPDHYNGASLLGLRAIVIKSHGSADVSAMVNAISGAVHEVKRQVPSRISDQLAAVLFERH